MTVDRIAGAPISWGVCEVPGWGYQLPPARVLAEMHEVGLAATELGPDGFLPADPGAMADVLARHELQAIGGFTPLLLHVPDRDPVPEVEKLLQTYAATGSDVLVLSAVTGLDGYDERPDLDADGWRTLLGNLDRLDALAAAHGVQAVLHPHVGTMVENGTDVQRVLDGSSIALCLDTGHLLIGGADPARLARDHADRIKHVHLKDIRKDVLDRCMERRFSFLESVIEGAFTVPGDGVIDFEPIFRTLADAGYEGWLIVEAEQDPHKANPLEYAKKARAYLRQVAGI